MQSNIAEYMISSIKVALNNTTAQVPGEGFGWKEFYLLCKMHDVANLVCYALDTIKNKLPAEIFRIFEEEKNSNIVLDATQQYEADILFDEFEKNKLKYMPLKGYIIKGIYPFSDMRTMCDIDILISNDSHQEYEQILIKNGYIKKDESNHEYIYSKGNLMNIELHKSIVPTYDNDLYSYYGDGWAFAKKSESGHMQYKMSDEDFFVFMIAHFAKHYRKAGIGIRHLVDIYLFEKKFMDQMDIEYIFKQLKLLNLYTFYKNTGALISWMFDDGEATPLIIDMCNYIMSCGSYGNSKNNAVNTTIKTQNKYKTALGMKLYNRIKLLFPPLSVMQKKYEILQRHPWLYPAVSIFRVFKGIFGSYSKAKTILANIETTDEDAVKKASEHFNAVGLDMNKISK